MRSIRQALQSIRHDLDRLRTPGSFTRNSFHFLSGNALGMLSQVVLTPIIARIYGPEAYGMFGLYLALVMNSASVSDLGFSAAYVLPREEGKVPPSGPLQPVAHGCGVVLLPADRHLLRTAL
ncbi:MAG: oligosaccharide flippase family protein [Flavobacteriales bacterium]|nr:oligosaccharide flippase family protein [Flavobacteriales bacterium]